MNAHLYIFSDACPTDWLEDGKDDQWHTVVNFVFQSDPSLQMDVDEGLSHSDILNKDPVFTGFTCKVSAGLRSGQLRKWATSSAYKSRFCQSFVGAQQGDYRPIISACSFQEKTLRAKKEILQHSYNQRLGGIEGRGIGFEEFVDDKGRLQMKHSFVNFFGYHEIQCPENQMLVILLMAWFIADQYGFYRREIVECGQLGFNELSITVVSDKLSGDDDFRPKNKRNLRNLIDPEMHRVPIVLTRSAQSDVHPGDLIVDNLAGWLNAAISDPSGEFARAAKGIEGTGIWNGWHELSGQPYEWKSTPVIRRLNSHKPAPASTE